MDRNLQLAPLCFWRMVARSGPTARNDIGRLSGSNSGYAAYLQACTRRVPLGLPEGKTASTTFYSFAISRTGERARESG